MATFAEMQDRIGLELGRTDLESTGANVARTKNSIQDAIKAWKNTRFRFNELTTSLITIATVSDYTTSNGLTDGILEIDEITITYSGARYPLEEITAARYAELNGSNPSVGGVPSYYTWYGDTLRLFPTPNAVYTLWILCHAELALVGAGTETNAWTTQAETLIRNTAKADLCANFIRDAPSAQLAQMAAELSYKSLRREYEMRASTGHIDPHE